MTKANARSARPAGASTAWLPAIVPSYQSMHSVGIRAATVLTILYACVFVPGFADGGNVQAILFSLASIGVAAVGMAAVTISGNLFMLSLGATAALSSVVFSSTLQFGLPLALLITVGFGASTGLLQGALVAFAAANPIITTIAVSSIITGIGVLWTGGQTIFGVGDASWLGSGYSFGHIPNQIVVMLVFAGSVAFVFARMRVGREIRLIGMEPTVATFTGLRTGLAICLTYAIAGFSAALSGAMIASSASQGNMTYGVDLDFNAIAAVLVGGISIRGGRGSVFDALVGAAFLSVIGNLLLVSGARYESQLLVKGAVVLGSVIIGTLLLRYGPKLFAR